MVFTGQPNLYVRISSKLVQRATGKKGFIFDEHGKYETDNDLLCRVLKQHFETEIKEENSATDDKPETTYQCKHCDYTTTNKGELLAHYRKAHSKG